MRALAIALATLFIAGCYPIKKETFETIQRTQGEIEQLKQTDKELKEEIRSIKDAMSRMQMGMKPEIEQQTVTVTQPSETIVQVVVQEQLLFDSGSTVVSRDGRKLLARFAEGFRKAPVNSRIRIVGHTDAMPVGQQLRDKYVDNWELSAARAAAVARSLIWGEDINPKRLHVEASAQTEPVADNRTAEGRAKNRRIEIFLEEI